VSDRVFAPQANHCDVCGWNLADGHSSLFHRLDDRITKLASSAGNGPRVGGFLAGSLLAVALWFCALSAFRMWQAWQVIG
jgi:hypothetical protein